ncbi:hypothetical protein PDIDSM_2437 [Penicillium digitatum]|nr:hypothetical protein PDIDSM_2437 [Penicillium digitatum]
MDHLANDLFTLLWNKVESSLPFEESGRGGVFCPLKDWRTLEGTRVLRLQNWNSESSTAIEDIIHLVGTRSDASGEDHLGQNYASTQSHHHIPHNHRIRDEPGIPTENEAYPDIPQPNRSPNPSFANAAQSTVSQPLTASLQTSGVGILENQPHNQLVSTISVYSTEDMALENPRLPCQYLLNPFL